MQTTNQQPKLNHALMVLMAIFFASLLFLLPGCKTCPPASVVIHDSIHESIVYIPHDTLIYVTQPPVTITQQLECDSLGIIKAFKRTFKSHGIKITEQVSEGVLTVDCQADSLQSVITLMNKEKNEYIEHYKSEVKVETKVVNAWWVKPLCWIALILFIISLWAYRKDIAKLFI